MNTRRIAVASLLLAAGLGLTACGTNPATTPPAQVSPVDALTNALATLKNTGYDATLTHPTYGITVTTSVDYANKAGTQAVSVNNGNSTRSQAYTEIGSDLWVRADFGTLNQNLNIDKARWYKVDASKLTPGHMPFDLRGAQSQPTGMLAWPLGIGAAFANVGNVTRTDATHLAGVVDLTTVDGPAVTGKSSGADAAVPFTVTLDGQGRPTELKFTGANDYSDLRITFSNYGSPTPIVAPAAADVLPAPDALYEVLNETTG